jgi:hypothetical protein
MSIKHVWKKNIFLLVIATLAIAVFFLVQFLNSRKLLIAPMIGGLDTCIFNKQRLLLDSPDAVYSKLCAADKDSPSGLVESTLQKISKKTIFNLTNYKLGYTFYVPLLKLFEYRDGNIELNADAIQRIAKTIQNVDRPVILYLFSNHFEVSAKIEEMLAQNPDNLLKTATGTMSIDTYYDLKIYPWSFVSRNNDITKLREKAFHAVLDAVCNLPRSAQNRIEGVTILGETHQLFPKFQSGMGFSGNYLISDYSELSIKDFRRFLSENFVSVADLNKRLGSSYATFDEINPPSKNIRTDPLKNYWEHIDAYAHGTLPLSGWVAKNPKNLLINDWVHIYLNGTFIHRTPVAFGRQDVIAAHPELSSADVGWSYDLNFANLTPGLHRIDLLLSRGNEPFIHLASRQIAIMEKSQATPSVVPSARLPLSVPPNASMAFHVDSPGDLTSYYFNPLVPLWHEFRKQQVSVYLEIFGNIAKNKCINKDLIFSHQILPFVNPGWDENKYAVGRDLAVPNDMQLGVSLYGEASYGSSFFEWFKETGRMGYGITEFHPLKAMDAKALDSIFNQHYLNDARFLSFFIEASGLDGDPQNKPNLFSFDLKNKNAGSDVLYQSTVDILR